MEIPSSQLPRHSLARSDMSSSIPSAAEAAKNESVREAEFDIELDAEVIKCGITHTIFFKALWTKAR